MILAEPTQPSDPNSSLLPHPGNVLGGRTAEEAAVLPAELRSAQIAHALARGAVHHGREHQTSRLLQPQYFLVMQRAHRSDRLKVLVERGTTHVHSFGQVFNFHGLREVVA